MASGRIRGITIELSGDTKGLVKSLNNAKKSVKDVQSALKDVDKLLELDPKNVELVAQKQKLLKEQTQALKEKLEAAKSAMEGFKDAGDDENSIRAQEALTREIAETEAQIREAEQAEADFNAEVNKAETAEKDAEKAGESWTSSFGSGIAAAGQKLQEFGSKVTEVGEQLTQKVTGPIVALGTASVAAFKGVDKGYDAIIKKTGATGETLEGMKGSFDNIASTVPADMEDIGSAIGEVNTKFGSTGTELETLSTKFLMFAQLNDQDVSTAVDQTQKALAAFGLGAESAGGLLDTMNKVAQDTGVGVDKLASGLVENGAAFQELGLNIDQATVVMGQLEKSGANSETVMAGLRKALKQATKEGKPLDQALSELQSTIENGSGSMDGLTASYELFGKSGDQIYAAVKNGTLDFREFGNAAVDAGGSVDETFQATLDPVDQFKLAMQDLMLVGAELGEMIGEVLQPILEALREKIQALKEWWAQLTPEQQAMIVKIGMIVAAIGPLLVIVGKVISVIGTIMTLAPVLGTVIAAITGPIGLVIAAIGLLVAAGVWLYKHWDEVKQKALEIWEAIKENVIQPIQQAKQDLEQKWSEIKQAAVEKYESIRQKAEEIWSQIKQKIIQPIIDAKKDVEEKIQNLKKSVEEKWEALKTSIGQKVEDLKEKLTKPFKDAKETIDGIVETIKGFFPINISNILSNIKLPHFSLSGSLNPTKWATEGFPKINVEWYAKAMQNGMILDGATIFGMGANGNLLGGGEAGRELIVGVNSLQNMIRQSMARNNITTAEIYSAVKAGMKDANVVVYMDGRKVTEGVNRQNDMIAQSRARMQGAY